MGLEWLLKRQGGFPAGRIVSQTLARRKRRPVDFFPVGASRARERLREPSRRGPPGSSTLRVPRRRQIALPAFFPWEGVDWSARLAHSFRLAGGSPTWRNAFEKAISFRSSLEPIVASRAASSRSDPTERSGWKRFAFKSGTSRPGVEMPELAVSSSRRVTSILRTRCSSSRRATSRAGLASAKKTVGAFASLRRVVKPYPSR